MPIELNGQATANALLASLVTVVFHLPIITTWAAISYGDFIRPWTTAIHEMK